MSSDELFEPLRRQLMSEVAAQLAVLGAQLGCRMLSERVMQAMERVPRHEFVPAEVKPFAYMNTPLPIGCGKTISQPFIVALMTDLLQPAAGHIVLEVGTGSGYQSAILGELVQQVYSIEIVATLAEQAHARLARLGCSNVEVRHGDGYQGWPEHAPFDGVIVTAAAPFVPPPLIEQLGNGGRMVIPVDEGMQGQYLMLLEKHAAGEVTSRTILPVAFVPLIRRLA
jgi:protein-L-isoaspartate(D-aspartate) O-methyltransferase